MISRRRFLSFLPAPAIVHAANLMSVRPWDDIDAAVRWLEHEMQRELMRLLSDPHPIPPLIATTMDAETLKMLGAGWPLRKQLIFQTGPA
jgi:hypothetical protein